MLVKRALGEEVTSLISADNQPIINRPLKDSVWLTSFITPQNPDVMLKYQALTEGLSSTEDRINALWQYVANLPYRETIKSRFSVNGETVAHPDTWLFPSETMQTRYSNCANRSFLLASLLKNELLSAGQVYCSLGYLKIDDVGAHAWNRIQVAGGDYILETTQPSLVGLLVPVSAAPIYDEVLAFDENGVYTVGSGVDVAAVLNAKFGLCAIDFLRDYLSERCLGLEV